MCRAFRPWASCLCLAATLGSSGAFAQVAAYEANYFPEQRGWQRRPVGDPQGERVLEDGWFIQTLRLPKGWPGPTGEYDAYRIELDWLVGVDGFFVEWRAVTDNPAWIIDEGQVPAVASAAGRASSWYHVTFSEANAAFFRDPIFPLVVAEVSINSAHTYRVEVFADQYAWYVDGIVVDTGVPEGPYPDPDAFLIWGARREYVDATTAWDYVRTGRIPDDASGDYDSDGTPIYIDYYFVHDCLTKDGPGIVAGPGNTAGPGCRFTDFDGNSSVDLRDFAEFQNIFLGVPCEPFCSLPFAPESPPPAEE